MNKQRSEDKYNEDNRQNNMKDLDSNNIELEHI